MKFQAFRLPLLVCLGLLAMADTSSDGINAATEPAMPWQHTTSANTDPRLGLVAVDGPSEGGKFIAVCSKTTLYKGKVAQQIGDEVFKLEETVFADECRNGDTVDSVEPAPGSSRMINTDYRSGWVIQPTPTYGPSDSESSVGVGLACSGTSGVAFTLMGGMPSWEITPNVYECGAGHQGLAL